LINGGFAGGLQGRRGRGTRGDGERGNGGGGEVT
jgi:hypothetical protein